MAGAAGTAATAATAATAPVDEEAVKAAIEPAVDELGFSGLTAKKIRVKLEGDFGVSLVEFKYMIKKYVCDAHSSALSSNLY